MAYVLCMPGNFRKRGSEDSMLCKGLGSLRANVVGRRVKLLFLNHFSKDLVKSEVGRKALFESHAHPLRSVLLESMPVPTSNSAETTERQSKQCMIRPTEMDARRTVDLRMFSLDMLVQTSVTVKIKPTNWTRDSPNVTGIKGGKAAGDLELNQLLNL